ncbi:hypothetical protein JVU11DRAFT_2712 [Chiua virens]|nr:hypothetical protein JVU11DRAFT_2712 [Chiua virens]
MGQSAEPVRVSGFHLITAKNFVYCDTVAATALLIFDYCLTFRNEVEWLFGTPWTPARIHFTSSRYLPFVALALAIPTSRVVSPSEIIYCGPLGMATNVMYYLCIILAEAMLVVRTYTFWNCNKKILVVICTFSVVCLVVAIVPSETVVSQPANSVYKALHCVGVQGPLATALQFTSLVLYEMGMLGLNWIAFRRIKKQNSPGQLIITLYHDGMMYIATILLFSVINAICVQYSDIPNSLQLVLHSILASRIFFNLRETSRQVQENPLPMTLSEFHAEPQTSDAFSHNSMGNSSSSGGINIEVTRESVAHVQDSNA